MNLKRLTKKKKRSSDEAPSSLSRSCASFSNYDNYFFSSERKLDYSQIFFNDSEFLIEDMKLDEIKEEEKESPEGIVKKQNSFNESKNGISSRAKDKLEQSLSIALHLHKEDSKTLN